MRNHNNNNTLSHVQSPKDGFSNKNKAFSSGINYEFCHFDRPLQYSINSLTILLQRQKIGAGGASGCIVKRVEKGPFSKVRNYKFCHFDRPPPAIHAAQYLCRLLCSRKIRELSLLPSFWWGITRGGVGITQKFCHFDRPPPAIHTPYYNGKK